MGWTLVRTLEYRRVKYRQLRIIKTEKKQTYLQGDGKKINEEFDDCDGKWQGVRLVWVLHITFFVNSACHIWGYRRWDTNDLSKNNWCGCHFHKCFCFLRFNLFFLIKHVHVVFNELDILWAGG